jgi:WD40 repeat protein
MPTASGKRGCTFTVNPPEGSTMRASFPGILVYLLILLPWSQAQAADVIINQIRDLKGAIAVSNDFSTYAEKVKKGNDYYDYALKIVEMKTGKVQKTLEWDADWGNPYDGSFSPDGKKLAVMAGNPQSGTTAKVYDLSKARMIFNIRQKLIRFVVFSPHSKKIATIGGVFVDPRNNLWVWDIATRKKTVIRVPSQPKSLAFSPDEKLVVSGHSRGASRKPGLFLSETGTGETVGELKGHEKDVTAVAFSPDGKKVASGSLDGTVKVWDIKRRKELASFDDHHDDIFSVAFHPKESLLVSTAKDKTIRLWDLDKKDLLATAKLKELNYYLKLQISSDGKFLATRTSTGMSIQIWSIETSKLSKS